jgi:hypothetical protein
MERLASIMQTLYTRCEISLLRQIYGKIIHPLCLGSKAQELFRAGVGHSRTGCSSRWNSPRVVEQCEQGRSMQAMPKKMGDQPMNPAQLLEAAEDSKAQCKLVRSLSAMRYMSDYSLSLPPQLGSMRCSWWRSL